MIPREVKRWCVEAGFGEIVASRPVGGGCINSGARLRTASGQTFFLKTNRQTPEDMFAREAEGLGALAEADGPRVPRPLLYGPDFLLLEDLAPARRRDDYWEVFGQQLAALHMFTNDRFGFHHDNYIGSMPQPNPWTADGYEFFSQHRLLFQARLAHERGMMGKDEVQQVENLCARLEDLIPSQPASLVHGDLWSGNAITDADGQPAIIDPAAHYGWAEAELAMTALFGAFPEDFYRSYQQVRPLDQGYRERFAIYNLYHLINHVNLFGGGYLGQVRAILQRFA